MRYEIYSTDYYSPGELIETYPFLNDLGYEEVTYTNEYGCPVTKSYITVNSLGELHTIVMKTKESHPSGTWGLILDVEDGAWSLEIYDGYRE